MLRTVLVSLCALAILNSIGCGPPEVKPPPAGQVKGTVTLDGKPMATGEVVLSIPGQPVKTIPVTDGAFSGEAFVGKNTVEVKSYEESPPTSGLETDTVTKTNIVADKFSGPQSTLSADVTAAGPNEFTFDATSK